MKMIIYDNYSLTSNKSLTLICHKLYILMQMPQHHPWVGDDTENPINIIANKLKRSIVQFIFDFIWHFS